MAAEEPAAGIPPPLLQFCEAEGVDPDTFAADTLQGADSVLHLRLRPGVSVADLAADAGKHATLCPVAGLPSAVVVKGRHPPVSSWDTYKQGRIYPMDAASTAAVAALRLRPGLHVLELCCAPGGKLIATADALALQGSLVGVDASSRRIATTATLARRHGVVRRGAIQAGWRLRLLCADATTATVSPRLPLDTPGFVEVDGCTAATRPQGRQASRQGKGRKRPRQGGAPDWVVDSAVENRSGGGAAALSHPMPGSSGGTAPTTPSSAPAAFHRVLVDAECSHDGSLRHMAKLWRKGWDGLGSSTLEPGRLRDLPRLQLALLQNGWAHLAPGGLLVYCTCSLSRSQNEGVVEEFLRLAPDAQLAPVQWETPPTQSQAAGSEQCEAVHTLKPERGSLPHTLRFHPVTSGAGGLFVTCIAKQGTGAVQG